jgi:uroporphyrinogen decarboxylase
MAHAAGGALDLEGKDASMVFVVSHGSDKRSVSCEMCKDDSGPGALASGPMRGTSSAMNTHRDNMTSRQRVTSALKHEQPDRTPFCWGFGPQPPARKAINACLARWDIEFDQLRAATDDEIRLGPRYVGPALEPNRSFWGWTTKPVSYGEGHYDEFDYQPLATAESVADVVNHDWPDPDWFDYEHPVAQLEKRDPNHEKFRVLASCNPLETLTWLMGLEKVMMFLALEPEIIHEGMERVTSFFEEYLRRSFRAAGQDAYDAVFGADDLGGQNGPLMSPKTYVEQIQPFHKRICQVGHEAGAWMLHHSDGSVHGVLGELIDAGIDCLEAVQTECADMAAEKIKADFGERVSFQGAVSVQQVLPRCSAEEVRAETRRLMDVLGAGGGYICGPSHAIQAGTPVENVVAMLETVKGVSLEEIIGRMD